MTCIALVHKDKIATQRRRHVLQARMYFSSTYHLARLKR